MLGRIRCSAGVRRPDRRPDRELVRRLRPLRRRRHRVGSARRGLRAGAVRDERPPDIRHLLLRGDPGCLDAQPRAHRQRRRRPGGRTRLGRVDSRHPGRLRVRSGREHRRLPGSEHHVRLPRRVREDRQRRRRPGRDHELGLLRAGHSGGLSRSPAGRERDLRAGCGSGPVGLLGGRGRRQRRLQLVRDHVAGQPGALGGRSFEPALRGGGRRHDDRRRHPARVGAGLERRSGGRRGRRRHLRVVADAGLAGQPRGADRGQLERGDGSERLRGERPRRARLPVLRVRQSGGWLRGRLSRAAGRERRRRRVHRRDHHLQRPVRRLDHDRRHLVGGSDVGGHAGGRQRVADVPGEQRDEDRRRVRQPAPVLGRGEPDGLQGVVQRHHAGKQRRVRRLEPLPVRDRVRHGLGARHSGAHAAERPGWARLLPLQPGSGGHAADRDESQPGLRPHLGQRHERDDHRHELRKERRAGRRESPGRRRRAHVGAVHGRQPDADHRRPPGCLVLRPAERPDGRRGRVPGDRHAERRRDERGQPEHRVHVRGRQRLRGRASDRDRRPYLRRHRSGGERRSRLRRGLLGSDERHLRRRGRVDVHGQSARERRSRSPFRPTRTASPPATRAARASAGPPPTTSARRRCR